MKLNRKKFFKSAVFSLVGISIFKTIPFTVSGSFLKTNSKKLKVKINPSAVSRDFNEGSNA